MAYPAILGRRLDTSVINLGFSGNAWLETEVAELLGELDPQVIVNDGLPNNTTDEAAERIDLFMDILRAAKPTTPIVLVENMTYNDGALFPARLAKLQAKNAHLRASYERRIAAGDTNLYYLPADDLLGADREGTVDPSHPTDVGFMRMAEGMLPILQELLDK